MAAGAPPLQAARVEVRHTRLPVPARIPAACVSQRRWKPLRCGSGANTEAAGVPSRGFYESGKASVPTAARARGDVAVAKRGDLQTLVEEIFKKRSD